MNIEFYREKSYSKQVFKFSAKNSKKNSDFATRIFVILFFYEFTLKRS